MTSFAHWVISSKSACCKRGEFRRSDFGCMYSIQPQGHMNIKVSIGKHLINRKSMKISTPESIFQHLKINTFYLLPADRPGTGDYKMPDVRPCVRACVRPSVRPSRFIKGFITPLFMDINSPNLHKRFMSRQACLSQLLASF